MKKDITEKLVSLCILAVFIAGSFGIIALLDWQQKKQEVDWNREPTCYLLNDDTYASSTEGKNVVVRHYVDCNKDIIYPTVIKTN